MASKQDDHNQGQLDGAKAGVFDQIVENFNPFTSSEYRQGFNHGVSQQNPSGGYNQDTSGGNQDTSGGSSDSSSSGSSCLVSTACIETLGLPDNCLELEVLRKFRDTYVSSLPNGNEEIQKYYCIAPQLVSEINRRPDSHEVYTSLYHSLVRPCVLMIQSGASSDAFRHYKSEVKELGKWLRNQPML